jgi:hypothetical protein
MKVFSSFIVIFITRRKQMITPFDDPNAVPNPTDIGAAPSPSDVPSDPTNLNWYLLKAGLLLLEQLGEEKWVLACEVISQQGAGTFNSGHPETCTYNPPPGWVIIDRRPIQIIENRYGRGSATADFLAEGLNFSVNEQEIGDKWKVAKDLAVKYGGVDVSTKLNVEYERHQQLIRSYQTNKNTLFVKATANGGLFRKSIIHVRQEVLIKHIF